MSSSLKRKVLDAIWADPSKVFGCSFRPSGRYQENLISGDYDEVGKIRLFQNSNFNILVHYNGSSRPETSDVFTYLQTYVLHTADFKETLYALADRYGISIEYTSEERQAVSRISIAREICNTFVSALANHPNGEVAKYLQETRGIAIDRHFGELSEESIKAAKDILTVKRIKWTDDDFKALQLTAYNVQNGYKLIIPYMRNGQCCGFILRNINQDVKAKYLYPCGIGGLKGYCDALVYDKPAYLVEGQIDAVRLIQAGFVNVIAMGGATLTDAVTSLLHSFHITDVTYIPDVEFDEAGNRKYKIIKQALTSMQAATSDGESVIKSIGVVELPIPAMADRCGLKIDVDEFTKANGLEALQAVVKTKAVSWWSYELSALRHTEALHSKESGSDIQHFRLDFLNIYERCNPFERESVSKYITKADKAFYERYGITPQALHDTDTWQREKAYVNKVKVICTDLEKAVQEGCNPVKIAKLSKDLSEAQSADSRTEWQKAMKTTFEDKLEMISNQPDTLKTSWSLGRRIWNADGKKNHYCKTSDIEFYPADISLFVAPSSHGKTTMLVQTCLDLMERYKDKTFLYISVEENVRQLTERFLNCYLDIPNTECGHADKRPDGTWIADGREKGIPSGCFIQGTRRKTIKAILKGSEAPSEYAVQDDLFRSRCYEQLTESVKAGVQSFAVNIDPRLKVINTEASVESICSSIISTADDLASEGVTVGGVFIDYIQLLSSDVKSFSRHDELKDICKTLKKTAKETELPFIIAGQINRDGIAEGIDSITMANIAEGADIERIAHDIFLVWQTDRVKEDCFVKYETVKTDKAKRSKTLENPTDIEDKKVRTYDFIKMGERTRCLFADMDGNVPAHLKRGYIFIEHIKARDSEVGGRGLLKWNGERGFIGPADIDEFLK